MDRREFLKAGVLAGAAVGAPGCATFNLQPPSDLFSAAGMRDFLGNLDGAMKQVFERPLPQPLQPGEPPERPPPAHQRNEEDVALARKALGSMLMAGSFHDLPEEQQAHPGMQARLASSMRLFDDTVVGMKGYLKELAPTERAEISRELKDDPNLGMRIMGLLDGEAAAAGVPLERRAKLRAIGAQVCSRLQQSPELLVEEYVAKVEKLTARDADVEELQRRLAARMGEEAFRAHKERMFAAQEKWRAVLAEEPPPTDLSVPPPPPDVVPQGHTPPPPQRSGTEYPRWSTKQDAHGDTVGEDKKELLRNADSKLTIGGVFMGLAGVASVGTLVFFATTGTSLWIIGAFIATAAVVFLVLGIVFLIIGGVRRSRALGK